MGDGSLPARSHDHLMYSGRERRSKYQVNPEIAAFARRLDELAAEGKPIPRSRFAKRPDKVKLIERWRERCKLGKGRQQRRRRAFLHAYRIWRQQY